MAQSYTSGERPVGYEPGDCETIRIPYDASAQDHADVRRKVARGWKLGEVTGDDDSLFKFAHLYPPTPST